MKKLLSLLLFVAVTVFASVEPGSHVSNDTYNIGTWTRTNVAPSQAALAAKIETLGGANLPNVTNLIAGDGTGDGVDSGIDPSAVLTTPLDAHIIPLAAIDATPVDLSTVLSGSTYTLAPNTFYFGTVTGSKTFTISPSLTSSDQGVIVRALFDGSSTQTVGTVIREGANGSGSTVAVTSDGYYTLHYVNTGDGNVRLYDTFPQPITSTDLATSVITGLTEDTSPDPAADFVMIYDASGTDLNKAKLTNLIAHLARTVTFTFWNNGDALGTGNAVAPYTIPFAGTITGYSISADAGTATVKWWKKANGTAIPTVSDVINTSGLSLSSGTHVRSTTVTDFTTTAVAAGDMITPALTAVSTASKVVVTLEVTP